MVLFGVENINQNYSKGSSNNTKTCLVIITNEITNEILKSVYTLTTRNIIFKVPFQDMLSHTRRDLTFDFKADIWEWNRFVCSIEHLEFNGKLVKNQLNAQHFECMLSMRSLHIGSTDYALFDNENVSELPMIPYISLNGYGSVICSENMEKWLEKLKLNGCICERCY
jgi:hypothetical protein